MNSLWRLEHRGFRFELMADGKIAFKNTWPGEVPAQWAAPLLAEVRAKREEVIDVLKARAEWMRVHDDWCERLSRNETDPDTDFDIICRLAALAVAGQLPCYDGGQRDLGATGWQIVTERNIQDLKDKEKQEMGIKIEQTTYDAVPTGEYRAVITEIAPAEGKFGPQLQIKCEINTGPFAGNTFLCWVTPKFSPKSRLYEWVEAALAMSVPKSYTFDSDHLIGREVLATLVVRELDGGGEVNRVDRVRKVGGSE